MTKCQCSTSSPDTTLIVCCAGASDLGAITERATRELMRDKVGKMLCLAAVSAQEPEYLEKARNACAILAIDGCKVHCALKTLQREKIHGAVHLDIEAMGFVKGETPVSTRNVHQVADRAKQLLAEEA